MQKQYIGLVESATGSQFRPGNTLTVLQNGDEIFPAMLDAIRSAQDSIEFLSYVFWRGRIATEFADAFSERARAGVKVRLLLDAAGSSAWLGSRTVWQLERAGVRIEWFRPGYWRHLRKLNHRTHRKILLVDGHTGFTGGVGVADSWAGQAQDRWHWRETHCRVIGPACADLHAGFAESWLEATGEQMAPAGDSAPEAANTGVKHQHGGGLAVHTTISTAGAGRPTAMERLFMAVISGASDRLWITTAYFVPSPEYVRALVAAVERGVDVRILTNGRRTNHPMTLWAGRATYQQLLDGGVKLYEFQPTVLHSKVMTADRAYATIGSTNLDDRSLVLNDELNISVVEPGLVAELDHQFLEDLGRSINIRRTHWYERGAAGRLAETASSLFRGQL